MRIGKKRAIVYYNSFEKKKSQTYRKKGKMQSIFFSSSSSQSEAVAAWKILMFAANSSYLILALTSLIFFTFLDEILCVYESVFLLDDILHNNVSLMLFKNLLSLRIFDKIRLHFINRLNLRWRKKCILMKYTSLFAV